ncbi:MAG: choice-of-anchor L domain-containing protein, partial [Planctomycetales bacterium]|nr:choice-of-anchor L domain-containing protein [Planctomycetales bacterium]
VRVANGPNDEDGSTGRSSGQGDMELDDELQSHGLTGTSQDATSLEFDFQFGDNTTTGNHLFLNFVFASEEYNEFVNRGLGDALAIFIDDMPVPMTTVTRNIALLPPTTPGGSELPVTVDNVNGGNPLGTSAVNSSLYVNNDPGSAGVALDEFGYDGFTQRIQANTLTAFPGGLSNGTHRLKIVVADIDDASFDSAVLIESLSVAATPKLPISEGIPSVRHTGSGDQNVFRDQGQVLIHSNTISHSRDFGIVADAADRDTDRNTALNRDSSNNVVPGNRPVLAPHPGPARNLREPNDLANTGALGGVAPGVVIMNNTLLGNDLGGIHVSGDLRPIEISVMAGAAYPDELISNRTPGDSICDGDWFSLTVGRQTVEFEFEDIAGSGLTSVAHTCGFGSAFSGGDGWDPGRVPVFYRRSIPTVLGS